MSNRFRFILGAALLSTSGIILFQVHWLRKTYHDQGVNFELAASDALQRAVDQLIIKDIKGNMKRDTNKLSVITVVEGVTDSEQLIALNKAVQNQLAAAMQSSSRRDSNSTVHIRMIEESEWPRDVLQTFRSRILAEGLQENIEIADLNSIYRQELQRKNIHEKFQLSFKDPDSLSGITIRAYTGVNAKSRVVTAIFPGLHSHLIGAIINPILISGLLLIFSLGSLWYMWHIIIRQKRLDMMKNDFIDNMTHELKTPVTIMCATNESLLSFGGIDDKKKTLRYLVHNRNELTKLRSMINSILTLTQYERNSSGLTVDYFNLGDLAEGVVNRYRNTEGVNIRLQCADDDIWIYSNKEALEIIINNLIDNGIKYNNETEKRIDLTVVANKNSCSIKVGDNGIGISSKYLPYIFDKFYRVPKENIHDVKGFGLGLNYVKTLVDQLNGTVEVDSREGVGTTFLIKIPAL